jgi:GAF domain-containing protein
MAALTFAQADVLLSVLQHADSGIDSVMHGLNVARQTLLGPGHMTVNININPEAAPSECFELQRIWSSQPDFDAVGGRKRKEEKPWTRTVLRECRVFVGEGDDAIAASFDDHERLRSIDLHAIVNVPVAIGGKCLATLNVLTTRPAWMAGEIALLKLFALIGRSSILRRRDEVIEGSS